MQSFDIEQLRTFIAIAQTGSFTRAAGHVHKTQSAVSVQIKRLEEITGKPLIQRVGKKNLLTLDGERLLDYARKIVDLNMEAMSALTQPSLSGHVRIGTPVYAEGYFPGIYARFAKTYPNVEIEISTRASQRLVSDVDSGALDLAIVTHSSSGQRGEVIRREQLYWLCATNCTLHKSAVVPLALYQSVSSLRQVATDAMEKAGKRYRVAYSSQSHDALFAAVRTGLAVGFMPGCSLHGEFRVLGERQGFPLLPEFDIALLQGANANEPHITAMARHMREALSNLKSVISAANRV
ncbi:MAG: LysR family transcriptional regulator [Chitinophagales bacterium]|nr:LysR family transcriptional regulator [Hyphomicrobiales bacterium]